MLVGLRINFLEAIGDGCQGNADCMRDVLSMGEGPWRVEFDGASEMTLLL